MRAGVVLSRFFLSPYVGKKWHFDKASAFSAVSRSSRGKKGYFVVCGFCRGEEEDLVLRARESEKVSRGKPY